MTVPSENANCLVALRIIDTESKRHKMAAIELGGRTEARIAEPHRFLDKTVKLVHLVDTLLRPAFYTDNGFHFFPQGLDVFWTRN